MRGDTCGMHPARVMKGKKSPCGRLDSQVEVEDHGVGYLFIGCSDLSQACRLLDEYVDNVEDYRFFARVLCEYEGVEPRKLACGVWASDDVSALWYGADGSIRVWV